MGKVTFEDERVYEGVPLETMKECVQAANELTKKSVPKLRYRGGMSALRVVAVVVSPFKWPELKGSTLSFECHSFLVMLTISPTPGGSKISAIGTGDEKHLGQTKLTLAAFWANLESVPKLRELIEKAGASRHPHREQPGAAEIQAKTPPGEETMAYVPVKCPGCGHYNPARVKFCAGCGRKLG